MSYLAPATFGIASCVLAASSVPHRQFSVNMCFFVSVRLHCEREKRRECVECACVLVHVSRCFKLLIGTERNGGKAWC